MAKKANDKDQWWYVDYDSVPKDWVRIEDLSRYINTKSAPLYNPDSAEYKLFWTKETKRCIYGIWRKNFDGYRWMPGNLYYMGHYTLLTHKDESTGSEKKIRPKVYDLMWHYAYSYAVDIGFSGFSGDEQYSCHRHLDEHSKGQRDILDVHASCFKKDKTLKQYIDADEYLMLDHRSPLGYPLFFNECKNEMVLGSRGGSKSYFVALAIIEYNFVFGGAFHYDMDFIKNNVRCTQVVGASLSGFSADLIKFVVTSIDAKINVETGTQFGLWKDSRKLVPAWFYRSWYGNTDCNNRDKPITAGRRKKVGGEWKYVGTASKIIHISYAENQKSSGEKAVGGRYLVSVIEEVGLVEDPKRILRANKAGTSRSGVKDGVNWCMGTSGNLALFKGAQEIYLDPDSMDIHKYKNKFSKGAVSGKDGYIGMFIPFYMTMLQYKDKNGNTDLYKAINHVNRVRAKEHNTGNIDNIIAEVINRPCYVEEMWRNNTDSIMPVKLAQERENQLLENELYKTIGTPVVLFEADIDDDTAINGVTYTIADIDKPYYHWPVTTKKKDEPEGCIVIYEMPQKINGITPDDMYIFGYDMLSEDDPKDPKKASLSTTYVVMNPKYLAYGFNGGDVVASFISRTPTSKGGTNAYLRQQELLLQMYGNPVGGLAYESNKGADTRSYYVNRGKTNLLMMEPMLTQGSTIYEKNPNRFGYHVGTNKFQLAQWVAVYLNRKRLATVRHSDGTVEDVMQEYMLRMPCLFLTQQIKNWSMTENLDAFDGYRGCIVKMREQNILLEEAEKDSDVNQISSNFTYYLSKKRKNNIHLHRNA